MTESIISALIGTGGVAVGACVQFVATWAKTRSDKDTDASRLLIERNANSTKAPETDSSCGCGTGNLWTRYGGARPPPPPSAPDGLFQDNDDGKE